MSRLLAVLVVFLASCNPGTSTGVVKDAAGDADGGRACANDASAPLPACGFAPSISQADASLGQGCHAARAFVTCNFGGGGSFCLSDGSADCEINGHIADAGPSLCASECCPDEYGVECGGGAVPQGCRAMTGPSPGGGLTFSCCSCR